MLVDWDDASAVVKLARSLPDGRTSFRRLSAASFPRREVAFCRLSRAFGWGDLVPETALFSFDGVEASAQQFVRAQHFREIDARLESSSAGEWVAGLRRSASTVPVESWSRLALLDVVAGSRDRHVNNAGVTSHGSVVAWDNAASFGRTFRLYHCVFHKHLFSDSFFFGSSWDAFSRLSKADLREAVGGLVSPVEVEHAWVRHQFICDYPYKAPWRVLSDGTSRRVDFPARAEIFGASEKSW